MDSEQRILERLATVEQRVAGNEARLASQQSQISDAIGGFKDVKIAVLGDLVGGKWQRGIREQVENQGNAIEEVRQLALDANRKADKFGSRITMGVLGVWTIAGGLILELTNSYFGLWGAAHAAKVVTGGH